VLCHPLTAIRRHEEVNAIFKQEFELGSLPWDSQAIQEVVDSQQTNRKEDSERAKEDQIKLANRID
jgi:hypothetical protein